MVKRVKTKQCNSVSDRTKLKYIRNIPEKHSSLKPIHVLKAGLICKVVSKHSHFIEAQGKLHFTNEKEVKVRNTVSYQEFDSVAILLIQTLFE